ncbi:GNAT family N-acetyltransferase [Candidatus Woesearchaeota archaeon]|nr:GNAT family N-acetyltransferase [Candidatus Woesearchaeota archaeon]
MEYEVRELKDIDLEDPSDFFETLSNLREVGELSNAKDILLKINSQDGHIFVAITPEGKIIGTATILIEQKFIRQGAKCAHLEDVSVNKNYEGKGIGSAVINKAIEYAKKVGCYKLIADSEEKNIPYYEKFGFKRYQTCMRLDL